MYTELARLANEFLITKKKLDDNLLGKSPLQWHKAQLMLTPKSST